MWFAPSGGRDRRSADTGKVELSPFDANSIEMMRQVKMTPSSPRASCRAARGTRRASQAAVCYGGGRQLSWWSPKRNTRVCAVDSFLPVPECRRYSPESGQQTRHPKII